MTEFRKLMAANRGEIAIRVFRSAHELGIRTVAIYSHEDRFAMHRLKADEAYEVGRPGEPIRSYLEHPGDHRAGQGEGGRRDPSRATASSPRTPSSPGPAPAPGSCSSARGPSCSTCWATRSPRGGWPGRPGVPVLVGQRRAGRSPAPRPTRVAESLGYPVIVKASMGGGGRGMRVVESAEALDAALDQARREAGTAFGVPDVFLEKFIRRAKHIEVQLLGDRHGNLVHLYERDCSVQRRHQKIIEIAPAPQPRPGAPAGDLRRRRRASAATSATRTPGPSSSWSTSTPAQFYFIEVNPRIQVEHTVTEIVTGIDLVKSQILIAGGAPLSDPEIDLPDQAAVQVAGLRVPVPGHDRGPREQVHARLRPDHALPLGRRAGHPDSTAARRSPAAIITPFYDSLLVKICA